MPLVGETAAFGSVTLIAHTGVYSEAFKLWRASQKQPLGSDDLITAGQIGNLQAQSPDSSLFRRSFIASLALEKLESDLMGGPAATGQPESRKAN